MKRLFATLAAVALTFGSACAADFPDISVADLQKAIDSKSVTILDANGTDSYKEGHLPGAIDFETAKAELARKLPKDKGALIVAYCGGPGCNAYKEAAQAAKDLGYTKVQHLSAGISGWTGKKEKGEADAPKKEEKKDAKKTTSAASSSQSYVGTMTGVVCPNCRGEVVDAFKKLPGVSTVEIGPGEKEGTQKLIITSTKEVTKDQAIKALGEDAEFFVVQDLAVAK